VDRNLSILKYILYIAIIFLVSGCPSPTATVTVVPIIPTMVSIPGGTFDNGTSNVTISILHMSKYTITQAQYQSVMGTNPSHFTGNTLRPVESVSWYNALVFCNTLSIDQGLTPVYTISGSTNPNTWGTVPTNDNTTWDAAIMNTSANGYRLPTESEYMWAAMGGLRRRAILS
jgi:formylglycine-generating enzyme required for sulfatase activity